MVCKYIKVLHGGCLSWEQTHFWMLPERKLDATAITIEIKEYGKNQKIESCTLEI